MVEVLVIVYICLYTFLIPKQTKKTKAIIDKNKETTWLIQSTVPFEIAERRDMSLKSPV